ncbi:hypothetical protein ACSSS7_004824 [Eimeria intestinalis]
MANVFTSEGPDFVAARTGTFHSSKKSGSTSRRSSTFNARLTTGKKGRRQALLWHCLLHLVGAFALAFLIQKLKHAKEESLTDAEFASGLHPDEERPTAENVERITSDNVPPLQAVGRRTPDQGDGADAKQISDGGPGASHPGRPEASSEGSAENSGSQTGSGGSQQDGAKDTKEEDRGGRVGGTADDAGAATTETAGGSSDEAAQDTTGAGGGPTGEEREGKTEGATGTASKTGAGASDKETKGISDAGSETAGGSAHEPIGSTVGRSTETGGGGGGGSDGKPEEEADVRAGAQQEASVEKGAEEKPAASIVKQQSSDEGAEDKTGGSGATGLQASDQQPEGKIDGSFETKEEHDDEGSGEGTGGSSEPQEESSREEATDGKPRAAHETEKRTSDQRAAGVRPGAHTERKQENSDAESEGETDGSSGTDEEEDNDSGSGDEESDGSGETDEDPGEEAPKYQAGLISKAAGRGTGEAARDTTRTKEEAKPPGEGSQVAEEATPARSTPKPLLASPPGTIAGGGSDEATKDSIAITKKGAELHDRDESQVAENRAESSHTSKPFAERKGVDLKVSAGPVAPPTPNETLGSIIARGFSDAVVDRVKHERHSDVYRMVQETVEQVMAERQEWAKKGWYYLEEWLGVFDDDVFYD